MASIKDLILSIESADSSFDEKLAAINKMEETLVAMRQQEEQAVQDNVDLIVEAIKLMEKKVSDQLEIAKSIVPEKGDKGDKGDRGADGKAGRDGLDGRDGKDGRDGVDGADGVSVTDAKIDFDGSLVITLSTGREINVGEVVAPDLAEKIKVITTMSTNGAVVIKDEGATVSGGVKSINFVGASVTATNSGDDVTVSVAGSVYDPTNVAITGGNINGTTIGGTTPAAGTFTTLTANSTAQFGRSSANYIQVVGTASAAGPVVSAQGSDANIEFNITSKGYGSVKLNNAGGTIAEFNDGASGTPVNSFLFAAGSASGNRALIRAMSGPITLLSTGANSVNFATFGSSGNIQAAVSHTASAVNYVQVTGAATGSAPTVSAQGSDSGVNLNYSSKGTFSSHIFTGAQGNQFQITGPADGSNSANRFIAYGGKTGTGLVLGAVGSDANVSQVFQPRGTGAIDLAAGSSGVNISNGGTVTALTVTSGGSLYTSHPTPAITSPTTAGGVQAVATSNLFYNSTSATITIVSGGTGYTLNDVITVSGGTFTAAATFTVSAVSGGVVTGLTASAGGTYSAIPTGTLSTTGGTGAGLTLTINGWAVRSLNITNAGSGYVEQPTVTFSGGGGGSGAAAYASVGSGQIVRSIGGPFQFYTAGGEAFRVSDAGVTSASYWNAFGGTVTPILRAVGSTSAVIETASGVPIQFRTNSAQEQLRVSHTASAVNYVQVTGAATGVRPTISAQGSDTNVGLTFVSKGSSRVAAFFNNNATSSFQFSVGLAGITNAVNYLNANGVAASSSPELTAEGTDTNLDIRFTPKGTGLVRFGTYTATVSTIAGYIEIKDSGGTVRRLAVVS